MKTIKIPVPAFECNPSGGYLFSIQPGIPASDALQHASLLLSNVVGLLDGMSDVERTHITESACHLASLAKAAIDALEAFHV